MLANAFDHVFGIVLQVAQNFVDGVALDDIRDAVSVVFEPDVNRIRIPKEIVQVTQDLLVRTAQEHAE